MKAPSVVLGYVASSIAFVGLGVFAACSAGGDRPTPQGDPAGAGGMTGASTGAFTGSGGTGGTLIGPACTVCQDFPADPILDGAAPPNSIDLFGGIDNSAPGGPCLAEPQFGALFPKNWLRPRFRYLPTAGQNLFEIRVSAENQQNDLVVFTTNPEWKMPKDMWLNFAAHSFDLPVTVSVRSVNSTAPSTPLLTKGEITIAPVDATGSMVYWAAIGESPPDAWLAGFGVGEEGSAKALEVAQVQQGGRKDQGGNPRGDGAVTCIGCHTSTPDGEYVAFVDHWPWGIAIAAVKPEITGQMPPQMTPGAAEAMNQPWLGGPTFSPAHWADGDRKFIASYGRASGSIWDGQTWSETPTARLAWFDLETPQPTGPTTGAMLAAAEGTAFGFIARGGDTRGAMLPDWSNDGSTIVYVSTNAGKDGRLAAGEADLYQVPYNGKAGGDATPISGAADAAYNEYYPSLSPDDQLIAFNRIQGGADMYYNPMSEVFVVPAKGGAPHRLVGNDPPQCLGTTSPGITNSWAKWSPEAKTENGKTYYWIIFSSSRDGYKFQLVPNKTASQLYVVGVVVENGAVTSYPAIYLWNQPVDTSNHTPAWDTFKIPPAPVPE
jgi:hypothetical protein